MKIGFVGLGKLGLPVSLTISQFHHVTGYDVVKEVNERTMSGETDLFEPGIKERLREQLGMEFTVETLGSFKTSRLAKRFTVGKSLEEAVRNKDIVFFAVQTPSREDDSFDTSFLVKAVTDATNCLAGDDKPLFVIISTVLPGTIRKEIVPATHGKVSVCYNAQFIAMGTTVDDFLNPEFILIGEFEEEAGRILDKFYKSIVSGLVPRLHMTWEEAELTKMAYNTYIGMKIVIANTLMEFCQKIGNANVDTVSNALSKATRRIVGDRYMRGGMGDGGACHPRDNLALAWMAKNLGLSANPFNFVMNAREAQSRRLASQMLEHDPPYIIMGARYKTGTNLTDYSASLQVQKLLYELGANQVYIYDPVAKAGMKIENDVLKNPATFLLAVDDNDNRNFPYPKGSTIIDPWRSIQNVPSGCEYVALGDST